MLHGKIFPKRGGYDFTGRDGGGPEYEADVEWQKFLDSYDTDESILASVGSGTTGFEEKYGEYLCYSQEMADKIEEICEKYGL